MIRCATKKNNYADQVMTIEADEYERLCIRTKSVYEQIPDDQPVSLYADLDLKMTDLMEGSEMYDCTNELIDIAKRGITDAIMALGGITPPRFSVKTATKIDGDAPSVISFHIIVTNYKMLKIQQNEFFKSLNKTIDTYRDDKWAEDFVEMTAERRNKGFFDMAVYDRNRKIRSPFSTKEGEDRPFKIIEGTFRDAIITMPAEDAQLLEIQLPEKKISVPSSVTVTGDSAIEKYCDYMALIPSSRFESYMDWFKIQRASANLGIPFDVYDRFMRTCSSYDYDNNLTVYQMPPDDKNGRLGWRHIYQLAYDSNPTAKMQLDRKWREDDKSLTVQFKEYFKTRPLILDSDETDFAKMIYEIVKLDVVVKDETYFVWWEDEWRAESKKSGDIVKHLISYVMQEYKTYCIPHFKSMLSKILNDESLTPIQRGAKEKDIKETQKKQERKIGTSAFVNSVYSIFRSILSVQKFGDMIFDVGDNNDMMIHYRNGVYDLSTRTFRQRVKTDYVTKFLPYDYIPADEIPQSKMDFVTEFFERLQPCLKQREFTLSYLAYCLTGNASAQIFKMNIGNGKNGKSTELKIHAASFPTYTRKVTTDFLKKDYPKRHKTLAEFLTSPIRCMFFEELPKNNIDTDFIKDWVDGGDMPVEIMYGTSRTMKVKAKKIIALNEEVRFNSDGGIKRRGRMQYYNSFFIDDEDDMEECPENHIYRKDKDIEAKFRNDDELKNAYFHLLEPYVLKGLSIPPEAKQAFEEAADENDPIMCLIDDYFEITKDDKDRISKQRVEEMVGDKYRDVASKLKMLGAVYNKDDRADGRKGKKGGWRGLKRIELETEDIQINMPCP